MCLHLEQNVMVYTCSVSFSLSFSPFFSLPLSLSPSKPNAYRHQKENKVPAISQDPVLCKKPRLFRPFHNQFSNQCQEQLDRVAESSLLGLERKRGQRGKARL